MLFKQTINTIICGNSLNVLKTFPSDIVDCAITSPPYWNLRDYKVKEQLGLEKTPEEYVQKLVEIFREVKRVLKKEGTLFLNLGDSYNGSCKGGDSDRMYAKKHTQFGKLNDIRRHGIPTNIKSLKPKDLIGIPWTVAFALRDDGWYLRQDIIWSKPNPMPESVIDRCTKSHEYIFILAKNSKYHFDSEAIKEEIEYPDIAFSTNHIDNRKDKDSSVYAIQSTAQDQYYKKLKQSILEGIPLKRNKRSVWTISTHAYPESHFATFPEDLVIPMIKAGTSQKGVCWNCGISYKRIIKKEGISSAVFMKNKDKSRYKSEQGIKQNIRANRECYERKSKTIGWGKNCLCNEKSIPAIVLDPFCGAGTTCMVAKKLGRNYIGIDLNPEYCTMAEKRIELECGTLF